MTEYHVKESCNKCSGKNIVTTYSTVESHVCEASTKCTDCGFEDYWAYGFFGSSEHMESNCKKYSF